MNFQVSLIYRSEAQPALPLAPGATKYTLHVMDSLISIGLVRDMVIGMSTFGIYVVVYQWRASGTGAVASIYYGFPVMRALNERITCGQ